MTIRSDLGFGIAVAVIVITATFTTEIRGALNRIGAPAGAQCTTSSKD